jgi:tetratricopeptide (TPR) repeat protein
MLSHRMRKLLHSRIWEIILKPWRSSTQPANLAALGIKGVVFLYQKNTTGAMVIFNRILAAHQTPWALDNKCIALSELGNLTEALRLFDRAITLNPHDVSAYYNGGIVPDRMKNLTGALTMYDKALKLTPRDSDLIYNLAIYALRLGLGDIHISSALGGCS